MFVSVFLIHCADKQDWNKDQKEEKEIQDILV